MDEVVYDWRRPQWFPLASRPNWRCRLGLHRFTIRNRLAAQGFTNDRVPVLIDRHRCLCGRFEYISMDGHPVAGRYEVTQ